MENTSENGISDRTNKEQYDKNDNFIIRTKKLVKNYKLEKNLVEVLKGVDLEVKKGEFLLIMGPSGSGKTTLLNCLGLIDKFDSGEYHLGNIDTKTLSKKEMRQLRLKKIGFIFQTFNLVQSLTAQNNVELPLALNRFSQKEQYEISSKILKKVGLKSKFNHLPSQLSAGEQQRVAIARAIVINPSIIIADEPTGNLDKKNSETMLELLKDLQKENNLTLLYSSHDPLLDKYSDITYKIEDGKLIRTK